MLGLTKIINPSAQHNQRGKLTTLLIIMTVCLFSFPTYAKYDGGTGEPNDPYLIYTAEHLNTIGAEPNDWDKHFKLMADIDLISYTGTDFNIIGYFRTWEDFKSFTGVFDGNGHRISNFSYTSSDANYVGLFGHISLQATVKDLGLVDPNIDAGIGDYVGSLVGKLYDGTITDCYVEDGNVVGDENVGGLVGAYGEQQDFGYVEPPYTISNCNSTSNIRGTMCIGGLVGANYDGTITNCYATGSVSGNDIVGGLVGQNGRFNRFINIPPTPGTIVNCYSTGLVSGESNVGGLVGLHIEGTVIGCLWDIETSSQTESAAGEGKKTAEMQIASTFLNAGWDLVDETANGTDDIWWIDEGRDYPHLWWEFLALSPEPPNGAVNVVQPVILNWIAGKSDLNHDIYFGQDEQAVADAATENASIYRGRQLGEMTTYEPGVLELGKTYYWRIDEYSTNVRISKGQVWSFTTANFLVVDDFEDYNDYGPPYRIFDTWIDGWDDPENGSWAGYPDFDLPGTHFVETNIVHNGRQSMPYFYDNTTAKYSEATMTLDWPRDWMHDGVGILSLWFYVRDSNVVERMYVAIANSGNPPVAVYHDTPNALLVEGWIEWTIELQEFANQGVDLTDVDTISIGFGDQNNQPSGSEGLVFFDDIRLYRPPMLEIAP